MDSFKQILLENTREYGYRLKFALPGLSTEQLDCLEGHLGSKYELLNMSKPRTTILQMNPLDFPNIPWTEVTIVDVVLGRPVSYYVLQYELRDILHLPENFIVVRSENEPTELETQRIDAHAEAESEAKDKGLARAPLLSTDSVYHEEEFTPDARNYYGDDYNLTFKKYLAAQAEQRRSLITPVAMPLTDPHSNPVTQMADAGFPVQDQGDFNANIKDAPKIVPGYMSNMATKKPAKKSEHTPDANVRSQQGNYDNDSTTFSFAYKQPKTGKRVIIRKTSKALRPEK
jgi:hypothetical protein